MEDNETTADLIAWLRRPREGENGYLTAWRDEIADRLEAAHKRERGDAAKLREALCDMLNAAFVVILRHGNATEEMGRLALCAYNARNTLAAPPRNCDMYDNESCHMAYHLHGDGLMTMQAFADWLFAPATEKEGGNDGR